jgi:hypothetical protein
MTAETNIDLTRAFLVLWQDTSVYTSILHVDYESALRWSMRPIVIENIKYTSDSTVRSRWILEIESWIHHQMNRARDKLYIHTFHVWHTVGDITVQHHEESHMQFSVFDTRVTCTPPFCMLITILHSDHQCDLSISRLSNILLKQQLDLAGFNKLEHSDNIYR